MASKRRTREEWKQLIEQQKASGLSQREWCEKHGIRPGTMRTMIHRLQYETGDIQKPTGWVEVVSVGKEKGEKSQVGSLLIEAGVYRLAVDAKYPAEKLLTLLKVLACIC